MKRLLAIFLSLTMLVSAAPLSALAASDNSLSQTITVQSQPDADLVQAIASDPFLTAQADSAPVQEQNATVDTSNVSMEATNSFGKLLLDGMDEENRTNFSAGNSIKKITLNGRTATVSYTAEEDADLVVGIYSDNAEQEMLTSGTTAVSKTTDGTAVVTITGEIPDYYVIKGYLLDKMEHAPLCNAYEDTLNTASIEDLKNATINDFPEERTLNLDDDASTNFAVVNPGVTLLTQESNPVGKNQVANLDNDSLNYTIANASEEIKNLQVGDILTYEYEMGELLIVRVSSIDVTGDTVVIQGDNALEITDVFEELKIEVSVSSGEFVHSDEGMEPGVTYLGIVSDDVDQTNAIENVSFGKHKFSLNGTFKSTILEDGFNDDDVTGISVTVSGELEISPTLECFDFYIVPLYQHAELSFSVDMEGTLQVEGKLSYSFPLGPFAPLEKAAGALKKVGVTVELEPKFIVEVSGKTPVLAYTYKKQAGFSYDNYVAVPVFRVIDNPGEGQSWVKSDKDAAYGKIFIGVEVGPKIASWQLIDVKFKLKGGLEVKLTATKPETDAKHLCDACASITEKLVGTAGISFVIFPGLKELTKDHVQLGFVPPSIKLLDIEIARQYWSVTYMEFGWGDCPHMSYKITASLEGVTSEGVVINERDTSGNLTTIGKTDADGTLVTYLNPGEHKFVATVQDKKYSKTFTVKDTAFSVVLKMVGTVDSSTTDPGTTDPDNPGTIDPIPDPDQPGTTKPNIPTGGTVIASGSCGKNEDNKLNWMLDSNGVLTISGSGSMMNYDSTEVPWAENRDKIKYLIVKEGVGGLGNRAFANCTQLTYVSLPDSLMGMGYVTFSGCTSLTQIEIPKNVRSIGAHDFNGSGLISVVIPDNITSIESGAFYFCENLTTVDIAEGLEYIEYNVFQNSKNLTEINIPSTVKRIGRYSFDECESLQGINYNGTKTQWNQIEIGETVNLHIDRPLTDKIVHCTDGDIVPGEIINSGECGDSLKWVLDINGVLTIGGTGKMQDYSSTTDAPWNADKDKIKYAAIRADVTSIGSYAFKNCNMLEAIVIPDSVTTIGIGAFFQCDSLKDISYNWLQEAWNKIEMEEEDNISWIKAATIHCTDGDIVPTAENSITTGKTTTDNATLHAVFNGLTAGEDYAVIVSKSAENPLDAGNLIYINQKTAGANGVLDVPFVSSESGAAYVVACRKGGSTNPGGNTGKDDSSSTSKPGSDTTKPSTPEKPANSGGGGAIVAVVLIGGAAAAVTAGVILMMPVEVSGVAQLGDGNVLANANVQLMKDGQQVAQTTTDESGHFALEVKRGEYELRVTTVNPETGEQTVWTASVKAPAKNTNFVF